MIKITVVAVGKLKEKYLTAAVGEYLKRLTPCAKVEIIELPEEKVADDPSPAELTAALEREGERLLQKVPPNSRLYVLDLHGRELSSEELAAELAKQTTGGTSHFSFVIGGPFGLSENVRRAAHDRWCFSRLTFTHQMIRLLLVEQIYRAFKINRGEKYHW